jgi:hypothetical protein
MASRHFIPFLFVMSVLVSALLGFTGAVLHFSHPAIAAAPLAALVAMHLAAGSIAAGQVAVQEKFRGALMLPFVFFAFHFSYGLGTLWAFFSRLTARRSAHQALSSREAFRKSAAGD